MKHLIILRIGLALLILFSGAGLTTGQTATEKVDALKDTLTAISQRTTNTLLKVHCESILLIINSRTLTSIGINYLVNLYDAFVDKTDPYSPLNPDSYNQRRRPYILAWESPSDGIISMSWLKPPRNWDPSQKYPLYIELHGLWDVASSLFQYMTYPFTHEASFNNAFDDGYLLSPWGRGNYWYQGSSETDIWECIDALESIVAVDSSRKYLCGHSMGGYGAMRIAEKSPGTWAAVGIYAGALSYYPSPISDLLALKNMPTYFVCGTQDQLYTINRNAYDILKGMGNQNLMFTSFPGGHEYRAGDVLAMYNWMRNFVNKNVVTEIADIDRESHSSVKILTTTNPVENEMVIEYNASVSTNLDLTILDLLGRPVKMQSVPANRLLERNISMDLSSLSPGFYILNATAGNERSDGVLFLKK